MHYSAFLWAWSTDSCIKMHNGARSVATPILLYRLGRTEPKGDGRLSKVMVRAEGFEPPQPFGHKILSLARLPVPPRPQRHQQQQYTDFLGTIASLFVGVAVDGSGYR